MTAANPGPGDAPYKACWIPDTHTASVRAGVHFDAVRVVGLLGEDVAAALDAGPVVWEPYCGRLHFLVPPGEGASRSWPPGIRVLSAVRPESVLVPALAGNTYPLHWRSRPTRDAHLVDADRLHAELCRLTGWRPYAQLARR